MTKIAGHKRTTSKGKVIKIRPHTRDRNKVIDPGKKYVDIGDLEIIKQKLLEYIAVHSDDVNKFVDFCSPYILEGHLGFIDADDIFNNHIKNSYVSMDFYSAFIGNFSADQVVKFANMAKVVESTELFSLLSTDDIEFFYDNCSLEELDELIEIKSSKNKAKYIKNYLLK